VSINSEEVHTASQIRFPTGTRIGRIEGLASFGKLGPWQRNEIVQDGLNAKPSPVNGPIVCDFSERWWHAALAL
jgi:hypothetical protein